MDMEGMVLGNRYEIIEKVGAGGMATVYKAKCRLLNRFVAVKVLREEFTNDAEFLARFKVEAQAAASLSHPNIVSVYDVGNQDNINYIVMEYLQGQTLKDYILAKGIIPWKKAVNIVIQICSALEHAHHNKIIHHDIKPHNIMLTTGMVTKVMDFGIARAVTTSTLTTASNAIGSVHYFSPEQARGGYTDEKSDLYSVGIVFYEMLTGKVPFDAETPVAIALKHLEDEIEPPQKINPNIPNSVNAIVVRATRKNKADRYASASEMIRDLYNALESPEVKAMASMEKSEKQNTQKFDTVKEYDSGIDIDKITEEGINEEDKIGKKKKKEKGNSGTIVAAIVSGIIIFLMITVGMGVLAYKYLFGGDVTEIEVPNIVNTQFEQANTSLSSQKITVVSTGFRTDDDVAKGAIISQEPTSGRMMKVPGQISVIVSLGKGEQTIPNVVSLEMKEAKYKLEEMELTPVIVNEYNDEIPKGYVFKQSPLPNLTVSKDTEVEIYVSDGPAPKVKVPNLVGMTEEQARQEITNNRLSIGEVTYITDKNSGKGLVLSQGIPKGNSVDVNTKINIDVNNYTGEAPKPETPEVVEQVTKNLVVDLQSTKELANKSDTEEFILKVETEGSNGKKLIYAKVHTKNDKQVIIPITGSGVIFVKVYIDDNLSSGQTLEF